MFSAVALLLLLAAQAPDRTASIEGNVVARGTGLPVAEVQVRLEGASGRGSNPVLTSTDRDGRYAFRNLGAGSYRLSFARNGFVAQEYGQRATLSRGVILEVSRDLQIKDLVMSLTPTGSVSGRITDDRGRPLEGIYVELGKQSFTAEGETDLNDVASARTNDRGEYRLYWITPGRYLITAEPKIGGGNKIPNRIEATGYIGAYYPGRLESSAAIAINVEPGAEVSGIDWALFPEPPETKKGHRLRGTIIDSRTGRPPRNVTVSLSSRAGSGAWTDSSNGNFNSVAGTFELSNVEPGSYWLGAFTAEAVQGLPARVGGQVFFTMPDRDIDGMALTLAPGITVSGTLRIEGDALSAAEADRVRVGLVWAGAHVLWQPPQPQKPNPDGSFTIQDLPPGPYKLAVYSAPDNFFVKDARLGQNDILGQSAQVLSAVFAGLDVLLSSRSGKVNGVVVDARRQPQEGIEVVLIPDQQRRRVDLFKTATADRGGRFSLSGIPPGNYRLFAWEHAEPYAYFDPEVVRQAEPYARSIRVGESSVEAVEIRSIP